jgi:hypothetical protein
VAHEGVRYPDKHVLLICCAISVLLSIVCVAPVAGQALFYTDDPAVTDRGKWHFEFFDEIDALQHPQYPNLKQNSQLQTTN